MSRTALIITMLVLGTTAATAGTFDPTPYLAEAGVDVFTRDVANDMVDRDLFGEPYATVIVGNVDVYDRFPYLEARYFQVVSDPAWNRLLYGEVGQGMAAYDGQDGAFGELRGPRGMSTDGQGRVYVADTQNDRVLVFQAVSEFDELELRPLFSVDGLAKPFDVAVSDGGTPLAPGDDRLYIANSGANEVLAYDLTGGGAQLSARIGDLGSATGHFAGPMAITVGRRDGAHTSDVYVSDAHNGRLVHLVDQGSGLEWSGSLTHDLGLVTSIDTDHYGSVYVSAPHRQMVSKLTRDMLPVAELGNGIERPRSFHIPFVNVHDHRSGDVTRSGQGSGIVVEQWDRDSGIRLMNLGVEIKDAAVVPGDDLSVSFLLTDRAQMTAEIYDRGDGRVIARKDVGFVEAGRQSIQISDEDFLSDYVEGTYEMRLTAGSSYARTVGDETHFDFAMNESGGPGLPERIMLLGNWPNPFNPSTNIRFVVPAGGASNYQLRVFDQRGRQVRILGSGEIAAGAHSVSWDGRDEGGASVGSGVYLYRLEVGQDELSDKMVLVK